MRRVVFRTDDFRQHLTDPAAYGGATGRLCRPQPADPIERSLHDTAVSVVTGTMVDMADVALFHPSFGVRPGVLDAAERLRRAGHHVLVVDQYNGLTFNDYDEADRYVERLGFPELMRRAVTAVQDLPDGFIAAGFSNGAGMAEYVATQRRCSGALLISGALPVAMLGAAGWPRGLPAQIHYTLGDPRRRQEWLDQLISEIEAAGAAVEVFDYPGTGHLFTDASLPEEYDETATEQLWSRAVAFCDSPSSPSQ